MPDTGFPCSANSDARILILGSMPSRTSLKQRKYYAHPQNAFWPIIAELFEFDPNLEYHQRLARLKEKQVALWDVAYQCIRPGSMDHAIEMKSVIANDFASFFSSHQDIRAVFFNGRKAEELYHRLVLKQLPSQFRDIPLHTLPSTSPANAVLKRTEKLERWKIVRDTLENL